MHDRSHLRHGHARSACATLTGQIEPLIPGISNAFNAKVFIDCWTGNPDTKRSYSSWKVGQYTALVRAKRERSGNCHFAIEQTSIDLQGSFNGAVDSDHAAAAEIVADYR